MSDATVFIVDDDQAVARSLRWLIETVRLQVETFASAQDFLDGIQQGLVVYGTGTSDYTALAPLSAQPMQGAVEITWA